MTASAEPTNSDVPQQFAIKLVGLALFKVVTMTLKKIAEAPKPCTSSEHNPPSMMVYEPGTYEYACPSCGKVTWFSVGSSRLT